MTKSIIVTAVCALTGLLASCISGPTDESNSGVNGSGEVWLSQTEVHFDMFGGSAGIQIKSPVGLVLRNQADPDYSVSDQNDSSMETYFASNGTTMQCQSGILDDVLFIHVEKSELRQMQCDTVSLYDYSGVRRASVIVKQAGNTLIGNDLGPGGRRIVKACQRVANNALGQMIYAEMCYTGIIDNEGIGHPMTATNMYNTTAYGDAVNAIRYINDYVEKLTQCNVREETPYYVFLKAILYAEMADKWGNLPVFEQPVTEDSKLKQLTTGELLAYAKAGLDSIATYFIDKKAWGYTSDAEVMYHPTKDVWRMAMAQINMQLTDYAEAARLLQQIVSSQRYELTPDNGLGFNSETIWLLDMIENSVAGNSLAYYTYSEALLMLAECKWRLGDAQEARSILDQIATAKDMVLTGDTLTDLEQMRQYLCQTHLFAFQKRNQTGGYNDYEYLWPIPSAYIGNLTQNPGY